MNRHWMLLYCFLAVQCCAQEALAANQPYSQLVHGSIAEDNLRAQQSMVTWAGRMFGVAFAEALITLSGVVLVGFTLRATRRAAAAAENAVMETRRIGEAEVRAYLSCEQAQYIYGQSDRPMGILVAVSIKNYGQSPAMNVRMRGMLSSLVPPDFADNGGFVVLLGSIPASGEQSASLSWPKDTTPEPLRDQLFEKGFPIYVTAELQWMDVFGHTLTAVFDLSEGAFPPNPPRPRNTFAGMLGVTAHFRPPA